MKILSQKIEYRSPAHANVHIKVRYARTVNDIPPLACYLGYLQDQ
jgi:hypothetical protein